MSEFKGTKGVWEVITYKRDIEIGNLQSDLVCSIPSITEECEANAKLIAAAPEMLEMLQLMIDEFDAEHATVYGFELCVKAKELIKKATL